MTTTEPQVEFPIPAEMQQGFWQWDKMHGPRPLTPLTQEIFLGAVSQGFTRAMDEFGCPLGFAYRAVNYYGYAGLYPLDLGGQTIEQRIGRYQATMAQVLPNIGSLWEKEWLPSILPGLERARSTDYAALSDADLLDLFDRLCEDQVGRYTVHGKINFVTVSASEFADFYNAKLQPEDPTEPYHVLQGFPTRSLDAGRGLWRLRGLIKASATLTALFQGAEPEQILAALETSSEGQAFLRELRAYLEEFGWRADAFDLIEPSWREDPRIPLNTLQGYLALGDAADPDVRCQESIAQRERLLAAARAQLAAAPEDLAEFERLYDCARWYLTITEDHNYYIDQVGDTVMRLPLLECGRRLVRRGGLNEPDDVFFLYRNEIRAGFAGADQRALVAQRRAEMHHFAQIIPVPVIGAPPPDAPADPFTLAIMKMFGVPPEPSRDADVIAGIPASRGTVKARVKVVRNLTEASKIEPGDVLVCEMTMPPWTPLFSTVSAVVADTGGVLSHCAIVSREYGLPCVVGTIVGTSVLKDGMIVTVDGSKGVVRIESRAT